MSKFYSSSTRGFYSEDIHSNMPADVVKITDDEWRLLLSQQDSGQEIVTGKHGGPIAVDPDPTSGLLARRDAALRDTDWLVARHRDERETDGPTTLTSQQYGDLQSWRRTLRDIKSLPGFPRIDLPPCPISI